MLSCWVVLEMYRSVMILRFDQFHAHCTRSVLKNMNDTSTWIAKFFFLCIDCKELDSKD